MVGLFVFLCASAVFAQDLSNIQIHGYVTQGFLFSSSNNYLSLNSSSGSLDWSDGVVSISDPVSDNLRVGIQLHMSQLGDAGGPALQVDWATADHRASDKARFSFGKVKTVIGLFNDTQDVDPVQLWALLPQGVYPIDDKSFDLAHYGADFYGEMPLGERGGTLSYRAYAGYRTLDLESGYVKEINLGMPGFEQDFGLSNALITTAPGGTVFGGDLRWQTPLKGLLIGSSAFVEDMQATAGAVSINAARNVVTQQYAKFERGKFFGAFEIKRMPVGLSYTANTPEGPIPVANPVDWRSWYVMTSYRVTKKLQVGTYYSHMVDAGGGENTSVSPHYSKDWTISGRYDFNSYFYAKLEEHFLRHGHRLLLGLEPKRREAQVEHSGGQDRTLFLSELQVNCRSVRF
ncbi:MAG: hypothetical protein WB460_04170 [Candidatus Acidiferrales bacterium]